MGIACSRRVVREPWPEPRVEHNWASDNIYLSFEAPEGSDDFTFGLGGR